MRNTDGVVLGCDAAGAASMRNADGVVLGCDADGSASMRNADGVVLGCDADGSAFMRNADGVVWGVTQMGLLFLHNAKENMQAGLRPHLRWDERPSLSELRQCRSSLRKARKRAACMRKCGFAEKMRHKWRENVADGL